MIESLYKLNRVSHYYGDKQVLDIERLNIPSGSILGLSGPNGSGKSTLLKILAFAMAPTHGDIRFNGREEYPLSPRVRSKVTLMTQKPYLLKRSVFDNVIYGLKIRKDTRNLKERATRAMESVGLDFNEFGPRLWHELSGGEAQRVALAARLILKPMALLLDEPVASVDTRSARLIRCASLAARDSWGCTLIIVSHDLAWLHECSDTRISMDRGRLFSTQEDAIIPPPYEAPEGKGRILKSLGQHESIRLAPKSGTRAVIPQKKIRMALSKTEDNVYDNQVTARVTQMLLEQKTGNILTFLNLGPFSLTLTVRPEQAAALSLQPGRQVILMFKSGDTAWQ